MAADLLNRFVFNVCREAMSLFRHTITRLRVKRNLMATTRPLLEFMTVIEERVDYCAIYWMSINIIYVGASTKSEYLI
jgi:hypothetical protein